MTGIKDRNQNEEVLGELKAKHFKYILMIIFGILIFYPQYFRGLYFEDEQFPAQIISFILLIGVMIYKTVKFDKIFLKTPIDYAFFGMTLMYGLSLIVSVNFRSALSEFLKYCFYFSCFYTASEIFKEYKHKVILIWVLIMSVFGVCIIGIDGAIGPRFVNSSGIEATYGPLSEALNNFLEAMPILHLKRSFFDIFLLGKIYSTYQYTNAFASVALAAFVLCITLIVNSKKPVCRFILGAVSYIIFVSMLLAQSRGVTILTPIILIFLIISVGKKVRARTTVYMFFPILLSALTFFRGYDYITKATGHETYAWLLFFGIALLTAVITLLLGFAMKILEEKWMIFATVLVIILVGAGVTTIVAFTQVEPLKFTLETDENVKSVTKAVTLEENKDYVLSFEVEGTRESENGNYYFVALYNKNIRDILSDKACQIIRNEGDGTLSRHKVDIDFRVPADSRSISVEFGSMYENSSCTFYSADIIEKDSGRNVASLNLKYKYLPESIASRFENMNAAKSLIERGIFNKDGIEVFRERWLMGAGGGAWSHLYSSKQSYYYTTTQVHNYVLQLAIETGILGLLTFTFLILSAVLMFLSEFILERKGENEVLKKVLQGGLFTSAFGMTLHSVMDFDFSLSAVFLLFCVITGLFNSRYSSIHINDIKEYKIKVLNKFSEFLKKFVLNFPTLKISKWIIAVVSLFLIFVAATLYNGIRYSDLAKAYMKNNPEVAVEWAKDAIGADPFKTSYKNLFVNVFVNSSNQNRIKVTVKDIDYINKNLEIARENSKFSSEDALATGSSYMMIGNFEKALELYKASTLLSPRSERSWAYYLNGCLKVCYRYTGEKEYMKAAEIAKNAMEIPKMAMDYNKSNLVPFKFESDTMQIIEMLDYLKNSPDKNERYKEILFCSLKDLVDADLNGIPDQWDELDSMDYSFYYSNGLHIKSKIDDGISIRTRKLNLEPGKKYRLEMNFQNSKMPDGLNCFIEGIEGRISFEYENGIYKAQIIIPIDYGIQNPALRIETANNEVEINGIHLFSVENG